MTEDQGRNPEEARPRTPRCPLCGKPRDQRFRPFCSARCRDIDLGRWFNADYAVPVVEPGYDEDEEG
jgi:endogenous inhibitor of DNA gyrase (YacG/DUF329 family)